MGCGAIGGKDSMSGTFEHIDVPPTLVSFAVSTAKAQDVISAEFKAAGHKIGYIAPKYDENGLLKKGVIIRHLVLPGCIDNSLGVLDWIAETFPKKDVLVSLMSQYVPMGRAKKLPPFDRRITQDEYDAVLSYLYLLELDNGYTQDFSAASADYIPEFNLEGL